MIPELLTEPYLIICEGRKDAGFLKHLLTENGLRGFQFAYPDYAIGGQGKDSLHRVLNALEVREPTLSQREAIIFVVDSDRDPQIALRDAQNQIRLAEETYGIPNAFDVSARTGTKPPVIVTAIPSPTERGNLETLLLRSIPAHWPDIDICLEDFYNCSPADSWNDLNKQSKMKMQCVVAAMCADDPCCSVAYIWKYATFRQLLTHDCFKHIVDFFDNVPSLLR